MVNTKMFFLFIYLMSVASMFSCSKKKSGSTTIIEPLKDTSSEYVQEIKQEISKGNLIIGEVKSNGNGCENQAELIINDQEIKLTQGITVFNDKKINRSHCSLAIPIQIKSNKKLIITRVGLKGVHNSWDLTKSQGNIELFETGTVGKLKEIDFKNIDPDFNEILELGHASIETLCGASTILRLNASLLLIDPVLSQEQQVLIDEINFPNILLEDC